MKVIDRFRTEAGIAMVTVLFVGAVLTAVASVAAFVTIQELSASTDDRQGAEALAIAEAGVDRLTLEIRRGRINWGDIREAGCAKAPLTIPVGSVGNGTYSAELTVYDPTAPTGQQVPASPWTAANDSAAPCTGRSDSPRQDQNFAVTSRGTSVQATRVVRQGVLIGSLNLPIGLYADQVDANGTPNIQGMSLVTPGDVVGREKIGFSGVDPYYTLSDFWPSMSDTTLKPAAIHSLGTIYLKKITGNPQQEHPPALNCTANPRGANGQSQWDQSGVGGALVAGCPAWSGSPAGFPPTSKFTEADMARVSPSPTLSDQDYLTLRDAAKQSGLYCFYPKVGGASCTRAGLAWSPGGTIQDSDVTVPPLARSFVAYFEYEDASKALTQNVVNWKASVWSCSDDPAVHRSAIIVVRQGSFQINANTQVNGAVFLPEGGIDDAGNSTINGTVIAKEFRNRGNSTYQMNSCWVNNMPGPFLDVTATNWSQLDR